MSAPKPVYGRHEDLKKKLKPTLRGELRELIEKWKWEKRRRGGAWDETGLFMIDIEKLLAREDLK